MSGNARDFNNIETRAVIKSFFSARQGAEGNSRHSDRNIRVICTIVCHRQKLCGAIQTWWFFHLDAPRPRRPKTVTTPEIIDEIQELIFEDCWISAKSIAEQLGISHERVGSIIHEYLDMWKFSARWVPKCLNADQKRQQCQSSEQFWNFFGAIEMISFRDWWPWTKSGYITMTRRQSNIQWSSGIAAHPTPKNSECKNPLEKFSARFFGIKKAFSLFIIFQRAKLSTRSITHLWWCNWRTLWRKNAAGSSPRGVLFLRDNAAAHRALATQKEPVYLGFQCLDYPTLFSRSEPVGLSPVPWTEKIIKSRHFFPTQRSLLPRRPGWTDNFLNFFEWLAKVRATG